MSICLRFCITSFTWYQSARVEHLPLPTSAFNIETKVFFPNNKNMERGMGSSLPTEKLDRSNYSLWSYKMHQYLVGHGYWSYVEGANDATSDSTHGDFQTWEQATSRVMYYFMSSVGDQLVSYIQDATTPKHAWTNLKRVFAVSRTTRKCN